MMMKKCPHRNRFFVFFMIVLISTSLPAQKKRSLTFQDIMKFKAIQDPRISEDGKWVIYSTRPDRGDGEVMVHSTAGEKVFTIERGSAPVLSRNSRWVVAAVLPEAVELEKTENDKDKPKKGMALLSTVTGEVVQFDRVERFAFSEDSKWMAYQHFKEEEKGDKKRRESDQGKPASSKNEKGKTKKNVGSEAVLLNLETKKEIHIPFVTSFAFDSTSRYFAYAVSDTSGISNGLFYVELLKEGCPRKIVDFGRDGYYVHLTWNNKRGILAYLSASLDEKGEPDSASLWIWDPSLEQFSGAVVIDATPEGWIVPPKNELVWTDDGQRLFFGLKPESEIGEEKNEKEEEAGDKEQDEEKEKEFDLYDVEALLNKREVDVWHWDDPLINSHQKKMWERMKDRTYRAVYHLDSGEFVALADEEMADVEVSQNPRFALGSSDRPYQKLITWDGRYRDYYLVELEDGSRKKILSRLASWANLSPGGKFIVYYHDKHWYLYDQSKGVTRNLTEKMDVPFYNEDHDYPSVVPGYGMAGWIENDEAVLIYDKYDIWQFDTISGEGLSLTDGEGRRKNTTFRIRRLDPDQRCFKKSQRVLLSAYYNLKKHYGFYSATIGRPGVTKLIEEKKRFRFLAKAEAKDRLIYTRESYSEFPDIWFSDHQFRKPQKISSVNPQISEFAWGTAELVEWKSMDGIPLQGVLIKPGNYERGKRYPVLVYFYRFFSQRLHEFNQMVINHRPNFPFYASNGYALFLPDIRFEIGRPGFAATKCLVPGIQKLIDMGIADPGAVALHGHSWSGYQAAFVITQTDIFACAVAGAPVSNMTSAYSGIRWGSGLARQFQYEKTQSRIGGSLWEYPERYIENSPVFFADRIETPLLIMFGDEDGAVPWYQGIELYLAMRRLDKDCIFLQYRKEPHHLRKYPNKLDYSIKMKEYLDHYCKGAQPAKWIDEGVRYRGE